MATKPRSSAALKLMQRKTAQKTGKTTRAARIRSASTERREKQKQDLRRLILDAASQLFLEKGYEKFSLRQVAERIGYSATTIYLYFENKDELILTVVADGFRDFDHKMEDIARGAGDPLQRIEALGRAYIEFGLQNPALYRLMFMQRSDFYILPRLGDATTTRPEAEASTRLLPAAPQNAWVTKRPANDVEPGGNLPLGDSDQPRTTARALLAAAVREAMDAGLARKDDPLVVADVLWAGAHGLVSLALSPLISEEHAQRVIEPLLQSLIEGVKAH